MKPVTAICGALLSMALGYGLANWRLQPPPAPAGPAPEASRTLPVDSVRFDIGASQLTSIRVEPVVTARMPLAEPLNARLSYNENSTARIMAPIAGRVTRLNVEPGDRVRTGDPLLTLDSPELAAAVADLQKARADEQRKRLTLERTQTLVQADVSPRKDLENAIAEHGAARAEAMRAERRLRNLSPRAIDDGSFVLRAPLAGVVTERRVNRGNEVRPDQAEPLFVISDPSILWVLVDLPERDLAMVRVGHHALVEVDAYRGGFDAVIERIGETVDPTTRRVQVRAAVRNPDGRLKPEMYARVVLVASDTVLAVRIPNSALVTQGLYSFVFVEAEPGLFTRRRVTMTVQDREYAYVSDGLEAGERLVTTGALLLNSELSTVSRH